MEGGKDMGFDRDKGLDDEIFDACENSGGVDAHGFVLFPEHFEAPLGRHVVIFSGFLEIGSIFIDRVVRQMHVPFLKTTC